jgi:hypothetical protein
MKFIATVLFSALLSSTTVFAAPKPLPNQAGNDTLDLAGQVMLTPEEVQQALGTGMGKGFIVVRITATPKNGETIQLDPADFTLISRKNGDRCQALEPSEIAGKGELVVSPAANQPGGDGTTTNGPLWGKVKEHLSVPGLAGGGTDSTGGGALKSKMDPNAKGSPLLTVLKQKGLGYKKTDTPVEGLLYFSLDGKLKPKDVSLLYTGEAGRLVMDFK